MANSHLIEGVICYKVAADNISAITYRFKKQARVVDRSTSSFLSQQQQEAMKTRAVKHKRDRYSHYIFTCRNLA